MTSIRQYVKRRREEILDQISVLNAELRDIEIVESTLEMSGPLNTELPERLESSAQGNSGAESVAKEPKTIKEMVLQILAVRPAGETANAILHYLNDRFGRDIERTSLSPQLSRLKGEGKITRENGVWKLLGNREEFDQKPKAPPG